MNNQTDRKCFCALHTPGDALPCLLLMLMPLPVERFDIGHFLAPSPNRVWYQQLTVDEEIDQDCDLSFGSFVMGME